MSDGHLISADGGVDLFMGDMLDEEMYDILARQGRIEMIPALGRKVYVVNVDGKEVYGFEVYAKGKDFFIPKGAEAWKPEYREIRFNEYGKRWFFVVEEAKAKLGEYLTDEEVIVEGDEDCWYTERI